MSMLFDQVDRAGWLALLLASTTVGGCAPESRGDVGLGDEPDAAGAESAQPPRSPARPASGGNLAAPGSDGAGGAGAASGGAGGASAGAGQAPGGAGAGQAPGGAGVSGGVGSGGASGGPSDGGRPDAGIGATSDAVLAPVPAGPVGPCMGIWCEGFEDSADGAPPNPARWSRRVSKGRVDVNSAHAHTGTKALHVRAPTGALWSYATTKRGLPVKGNVLYGRLFYWLEALHPGTNGSVVHFDFLEGRGTGSGAAHQVGGLTAGNASYGTWYMLVTSGPGGEAARSDMATAEARKRVKTGTWVCLEWMWKSAPGANEARVWADGVDLTALHTTGSYFDRFPLPTFTELNVGWTFFQPIAADKAYEIWIDDVAIGEQKLGCQ